jgi:hypothetical protein
VAVHAAYLPERGIFVRAEGQPTSSLGAAAPLAVALEAHSRTTARSPLIKYLASAIRNDGGLTGFLPDTVLPRSGADPLDLRLTVEPLLAQVPWELMQTSRGRLVADDRVRFVYRAPEEKRSRTVEMRALQQALGRAGFPAGPADGIAGPQTRAAVERLQRTAGLDIDGIAGPASWAALRRLLSLSRSRDALRVLVLRRGSGAELHVKRGRSVEGYEIEALYERAGWQVERLEVVAPEELGPFAETGRSFHVLHVNATMEETGSVPYLDFGAIPGDRQAVVPAPKLLSVTLLSRLASQLVSDGVPPLVVLDIAAPTAFSEALRQLLLRNDFAHQLARLGEAETVLATGLATSRWSRRLSEILVEGLSAPSRTVGDVTRELQRGATGDESLLTSAGTALVSSRRPAAMLPLGL